MRPPLSPRSAQRALILVATCIVGCFSKPIPPPPPGAEIAPAFELPVLDGRDRALHDERGNVVLLHFWATWCLSCIHELSTLEHLYVQLKGEDFEILAVAVDDSWEAIRALQEKHKFSFPLLFDERGDVRRSYLVQGLPVSLVIGRAGEVIEFPQPEGGNIVRQTAGAQRWDQFHTVAYFKKLLAN